MVEAGGEAGFHKAPKAEGAHTRQSGSNPEGKLVAGQGDQPHQPPIRCPECASQKVWKDGLRYLNDRRTVQRFLCRSCGYRFSEAKVKINVSSQVFKRSKPVNDLAHDIIADFDPSLKESVNNLPFFRREDIGSHKRTVIGQHLNTFRDYTSTRRVCISEGEMKNLATVESRIEKRAAGATERKTETKAVKGEIFELAWRMKKQGYSEETIRLHISALRTLRDRGAYLFDPESVKEVIARQKWSDTRRRNVVKAYSRFLKLNGLQWDEPKCKVVQKLPFIPTEQELDALIAGSGKKTAVFLQLLKETAMRAGEAKRLKWTDLDFDRRVITLNDPEKGSNPRMWRVSQKLIGMLKNLPKNNHRVFGNTTYDSMKQTLQLTRKRLAFKLQNPRLLKVTFHTFRHWKATMLYHQTKDPYYVKDFLGHKSIKNTEIYITIERTIFSESGNDEFTVKVATKQEEIKALLEVGFEYICKKDGTLFFRKRK